jgi:transcriptional regulator with XRE-family HTH domain
MDLIVARMKWLREKNRYSQRDIAKMVNMTLNGYQKIEYGNRELKIDVLIKLCDIFKVSSDFLLGRNDNTSKLDELGKKINGYMMENEVFQKRIYSLRERIDELQKEKALFDEEIYESNRSGDERKTEEMKKRLSIVKTQINNYRKEIEYNEFNLYDAKSMFHQYLMDYILELYSIPYSTPEKNHIVKSYLPLDVIVEDMSESNYIIRLRSLNGTDIGIIGRIQDTDNIDEQLKEKLKEYRELFRLN